MNRALRIAPCLALAACAPSLSTHPSTRPDECRLERLTTLGGSIDALAASPDALFAVQRSAGRLYRVPLDGGAPTVLIDDQSAPFAVMAWGGEVAWATLDGVATAHEDGTARRWLARGAVSALAVSTDGLWFTTRQPPALWRAAWPGSDAAQVVLPDVTTEELAAGDGWVAWIGPRTVEVLDVETGQPRTLADGLRRPRLVAADGARIVFAEAAPDLLPGRAPGVSLAHPVSGEVRPVAAPPDAGADAVLFGSSLLGPASVLALGATTAHRLDDGEAEPPVVDAGSRWYWVVDLHDGRWAIVGGSKSACTAAPTTAPSKPRYVAGPPGARAGSSATVAM